MVLISGERRWRASNRAGLPTIDCYFHESELSQSEVLEQQLIENCLREDLKPIEEAQICQALTSGERLGALKLLSDRCIAMGTIVI